MHVVGSRTIDRVEIGTLFVEHLSPVLIDPQIGKRFFQLIPPAQIDIGDAVQLAFGVANDGSEVGMGHPRSTEAGMANHFTRWCRAQVTNKHRSRKRSQSGLLKK